MVTFLGMSRTGSANLVAVTTIRSLSNRDVSWAAEEADVVRIPNSGNRNSQR
jgi:hypothetical protein